MAFQVARGLLHGVEAEAFVGIEVEDKAVGLFDRIDLRPPAVELDRAHLDACEDAGGVGDIELVFVSSAERRVGKECVRSCRSRWSPYPSKNKINIQLIYNPDY